MRTTAYIGVGSNLGTREKSIHLSVRRMAALPGTRLVGISQLQETKPVGPVKNQPLFLNAVAALDTLLGPIELLDSLLLIEKSMGRVRGKRWGPRVIDLDILLYGHRRIDHPRLRVPHPEIAYRPFILEGLWELGVRRTLGRHANDD